MQQHGSKYLPADTIPTTLGLDQKVKLQLFQNMVMLHIKLEMCPWYTDAHAVAKFAYSHKQKQKKIMNKGQSLGKPQNEMDYSKT